MVTINCNELIEVTKLVLSRGALFTVGIFAGAVFMMVLISALHLIPKWERGISLYHTFRKVKKWIKREEKDGK